MKTRAETLAGLDQAISSIRHCGSWFTCYAVHTHVGRRAARMYVHHALRYGEPKWWNDSHSRRTAERVKALEDFKAHIEAMSDEAFEVVLQRFMP